MKSFIYYVIISIILILLTIDVFSLLSIHETSPNLVLILIVFIAHKKGVMKGQLAGFFLGLILDLFSGKVMGVHAMAGLITGYSIGVIYRSFIVTELRTEVLMVFIATIIYAITFFILNYFFFNGSFLLFFSRAWIFVIYTTLLSPLFLSILEVLDRKITESY